MAALTLAVAAQPTADRQYSALTYVTPIIVFWFTSDLIPGEYYYLAAAVLAWLTGEVLIRYCREMVLPLLWLCLGAIVLNAFGWLVYEAGLPPSPYDDAFVVLYGVAMVVMLTGGGKNARVSRNTREVGRVHRLGVPGVQQHRGGR